MGTICFSNSFDKYWGQFNENLNNEFVETKKTTIFDNRTFPYNFNVRSVIYFLNLTTLHIYQLCANKLKLLSVLKNVKKKIWVLSTMACVTRIIGKLKQIFHRLTNLHIFNFFIQVMFFIFHLILTTNTPFH